MIVREATEADIPSLLNIAQEFIAESNYGWTYNETLAAGTYRAHMVHESTAVLVGEEGGDLVSCGIVAHDRDFCDQRLGYVIKFYVRQKYRGTVAGRMLALGCVEWFQANLCWAAFVTATANIGAAQDKQFVNLFRKFGFVEGGPTLMKDFGK